MSSRLGQIESPAPIKGYSHRGFIVGWCAITMIGVAAFGFLALPLDVAAANVEAFTTGASHAPQS